METGLLTNGSSVVPDGTPDGPQHLLSGDRPVVLKFGGTSVGKFAPEIAQICFLLKAIEYATRKSSQIDPTHDYRSILSVLEAEHIDAARSIAASEISQRFQNSVIAQFRDLEGLLDKIDTVDPHVEDQVVSVGEKLSSLLLAALLEDRGIPSQYVDLSEIIQFPVPKYLSQKFYQDVSAVFGQHLSEYTTQVPVITGFFGRLPGGLVQSLGRGYSDLCAALVAVGLQATELQVWKEVDGIFTADPRKVPTARLLSSLTPDEAGELTFYGSEVIHNFTLEQLLVPSLSRSAPKTEITTVPNGQKGRRL
ncbi:MAG: hypothetical protein Q9198_002747 [Flavoplaca austrocitrina]